MFSAAVAAAKESRETKGDRTRYKEKETQGQGGRETLIVLIPLQAPGGFKSRLSGG